MKKFTLIIPTFNHGELITFAIDSVLRQHEASWELFVIGDGSPPATQKMVQRYSQLDPRIIFVPKAKGPRNGELYRHEIITTRARGKYIAYLSDDDLYFADHLQVMENQFKRGYNFVNTFGVKVSGSGDFVFFPVDLTQDYYRQLLLRGENRIPLSNVAHTRRFYQSLPYGWRTTPQGIPTDLYMWQQMLRAPHVKPVTVFQPTVVNFASPERKNWPPAKRLHELQSWSRKIIDFPQEVRGQMGSELFRCVTQLEPKNVRNSPDSEQLRQILNSRIGGLVKSYFGTKDLLRNAFQ